MNSYDEQEVMEEFTSFVQSEIEEHPTVYNVMAQPHLGDTAAQLVAYRQSGQHFYVYCCFAEGLDATREIAISEQTSESRAMIVCIDWLDPNKVDLFARPSRSNWEAQPINIPILDAAHTFSRHWHAAVASTGSQYMRPYLDLQIGNWLKSRLEAHPVTILYNEFEELISAIFKFCFYPLLIIRGHQVASTGRIDIRDTVFEIYHERLSKLNSAQSPFITVEVKNMREEVGKGEVDQLANYLRPAGLGSLGILVSRKGVSDNGLTRITSWRSQSPSIIILTLSDEDLSELIARRIQGGPEFCVDYLLDKNFELAAGIN